MLLSNNNHELSRNGTDGKLTKFNHIESIQHLRGIACLLVLFHHISLELQVSGIIERLLFESRLGVQIFFIISGFVLPYSLYNINYTIEKAGYFLLRRLTRIDPPIWFLIGLIFIFGTSYNYCNNIRLSSFEDLKTLFVNIFYLVPFIKGYCWYDNIFWTLGIEFQFYILIALTYPLLMRSKSSTYLMITILGVIWILSLWHFGNSNQPFILPHLGFFLVGIISFLFKIKKITHLEFVLIASTIIIATILNYSITIGLVIIGTILYIFLINFSNSILANLGLISYSLYLTHPVVLHLSKGVEMIAGVKVFVQIAACLIFASLFYFLIEKHFIALSKTIKRTNGRH